MLTTKPCNLKYSDIGSYAEEIGSYHDIYDSDGKASIEDLLKKLGGRVALNSGQESLEVTSQGDFVVNIPTHTSMRRDRFTLAHELAHYFLHYRYAGVEGPMTFGRGERNRAETEANVFASALLMPAERFKESWVELDGNSWSLARRFEVSPDAASVRAQVLGLA